MRYLIPAAGIGRRMGAATGGLPKCLLEIAGEPLLGRLVRQIREHDPAADIHVVLGYRHEDVARRLGECNVVLNPFFDVTSIAGSLWFARACFDSPVTLIHGDLVFSDALLARLVAAGRETFIGYDSTIRKPHEINVLVAEGQLADFGEGIAALSGLYGGVLGLAAGAAARFRDALERRIHSGFNPVHEYYFFAVKSLLADCATIPALDFAGERWQEVDHPADLDAARARFAADAAGGAARL